MKLSISINTPIKSIFKLIELMVESDNECLIVLTPDQIEIQYAAEFFDHFRNSASNYSFFARDFDVKAYRQWDDGCLLSIFANANYFLFTDGYQNIGFSDSFSEADEEVWENIILFI